MSQRSCRLAKSATAARSNGLPSVCATMTARVRSERGVFELADVDVVGRDLDVDEDGNEVVLDDRIDGGREAGGDGDDLVARLQLPVARAGARSGR